MGLLDMFNDPQSAGLLGAAAQILERSGDTSRPYGLGQAMGTGISSYMQTNAAMRARKQQEEQQAQAQAMREMQMQEMQAQQQQAQAAQRRAAQVQEYLAKGAQGAGQMPMGGVQQQPQAQQLQASAPQQATPGALDPYSQRMQRAAYLRQGKFDQEADAEEMNALKFQPKVKNWEKVKVDGKVMYAPFYEGGGYGQPVPLEVAKELHFADSGQSIDGIDQFTGQVKSRIGKQQSLESLASERSAAAGRAQSASQFGQRLKFDKEQAAGNGDGMLPAETVQMMAQQYRAGDTSVMQNLGRGAQGAQNIIALRNEIARQTKEQGMGGADLAARNAEYFGTKAGQRTAGTRIANVEMASTEAQSLIPLARSASEAVARSGLLPFGKAQVMFDNQTNDPALRQFAAANNALVNVYSRAISPSGVPTVADKEHAREMISTAMDNRSYQAVLNQMEKEIVAARSAPQSVRKAFSDSVTGKGEHGAAPAQSASKSISLSDITETARKSGRSTAEVTAAARAKGYTIGGQ